MRGLLVVISAVALVRPALDLGHTALTYLFEGRGQRLTDVGGERKFAERLPRD
jgi:hypothetical protein